MTAALRLSELLHGRDLAFADLVALTGLGPATVTTGLYQLRQLGVLHTETLARTGRGGRPRVVYTVEESA